MARTNYALVPRQGAAPQSRVRFGTRRPTIRSLAVAFAAILMLASSATVASASRIAPRSAVSTYCARISLSKIASIVGSKVTLFEAVVERTTLECIYFGSQLSVSRPEVVLSMEPNLPAVQVATRAAAEARIAKETPKGVKLIFGSLSSVGSTAFSWYYSGALNGGQLVGAANNKGTTGYGAVVGGAAKYFGSPSGHIPAAVRLLALAMAA